MRSASILAVLLVCLYYFTSNVRGHVLHDLDECHLNVKGWRKDISQPPSNLVQCQMTRRPESLEEVQSPWDVQAWDEKTLPFWSTECPAEDTGLLSRKKREDAVSTVTEDSSGSGGGDSDASADGEKKKKKGKKGRKGRRGRKGRKGRRGRKGRKGRKGKKKDKKGKEDGIPGSTETGEGASGLPGGGGVVGGGSSVTEGLPSLEQSSGTQN